MKLKKRILWMLALGIGRWAVNKYVLKRSGRLSRPSTEPDAMLRETEPYETPLKVPLGSFVNPMDEAPGPKTGVSEKRVAR